MTVVERLEGLDDGQHLALVSRNGVLQYTWDHGAMVSKDGHRLEPWFFSGALRDGKIRLGDFRPAEVGEWFALTHDERYQYLVIERGDNRDNPWVAQYRRSVFQGFAECRDIVSRCVRVEAPSWGGAQFLDMTQARRRAEVDAERLRGQLREFENVRQYLRYARDYLGNAIEATERGRAR